MRRSWKGIFIKGGWRITQERISWALLIGVLVSLPFSLHLSPFACSSLRRSHCIQLDLSLSTNPRRGTLLIDADVRKSGEKGSSRTTFARTIRTPNIYLA